jgi:hypothetical protein
VVGHAGLHLQGFIYPFLHSAVDAATAPEDYDEDRAKTILAAYEDADIPVDKR